MRRRMSDVYENHTAGGKIKSQSKKTQTTKQNYKTMEKEGIHS